MCDNCNQSIIPCGPGKLSIRSLVGLLRVFHASTEGYINQEQTGLVCVHVRVMADQVLCVWKPVVHRQLHVVVCPVSGWVS